MKEYEYIRKHKLVLRCLLVLAFTMTLKQALERPFPFGPSGTPTWAKMAGDIIIYFLVFGALLAFVALFNRIWNGIADWITSQRSGKVHGVIHTGLFALLLVLSLVGAILAGLFPQQIGGQPTTLPAWGRILLFFEALAVWLSIVAVLYLVWDCTAIFIRWVFTPFRRKR
jgi:hypothetical protein